MSEILTIELGQKVKSKKYFGAYVSPGDVGIIKKINTEFQGDNLPLLHTLNIQFNGYYNCVINKSTKPQLELHLENYEETTPYEPFKHICDEVSFVKKERLDEMMEMMKIKTPIDTTTRFSSKPFKLPEQIREDIEKITAPKLEYKRDILGIRENKTTKGEKEMKVGLPYSVNFVEKHKRTTLVWHDEKIMVNYDWDLVSEENYETTKSEAHNEKFNHLFGFLMAYFKRVHQGKSKTQIKKYLNTVVYPMKQKEQLAFLQGVFYENCGLNYKEAKAYLDKVEKGENVNA
jgi:hypothetical protein